MEHRPYDCITQFVFVEDEVSKADIILVPGGSRPQVMRRAAELYHRGIAPYILPSGGYNGRIATEESEWSFFRELGIACGVPANAILREDAATNTLENAVFSARAIRDSGLRVETAVLVCKAHHSRRALLTYQTQLPGVEFFVSPVVDERNISRDNWFRDAEKTRFVMTEIRKIGTYFGDHSFDGD